MMAKKFEHEIEVRGHLIDSMILTKIFDVIMDLNGEFQVQEFKVGKKKKDESYAKLLIQGKSQKHLDDILESVYREGATSKIQQEIKLKPAPKDMVMPDDF
ncbi:MAG: TIGR00300 family protein, partial [Nitrosopumilaceae archaeon]